jgi:hypothetical protein
MTTTVGGSTGITVSTWANAARPSGVTMGTLGWNTDMSTLEVYSGSTWANVGAGSSSSGGGVTWAVATTSNIIAVVNNGYFANTTAANITVTMPSSAAVGSYLSFVDYARTFSINTLTLYPNGLKIQGNTANVSISTNGQAVNLFTPIQPKDGLIIQLEVQSDHTQLII